MMSFSRLGSSDSNRDAADAYVRYSFPNRDTDSDRLFPTTGRQKRALTAPSGAQYVFRGSSGGTSQWLRIESAEDLDFFEEQDDFEIRRE
jgi:hypothetical protein